MPRTLICLMVGLAVALAGCSSNPSGSEDSEGPDPSGVIVFVSDRDGDYEIYSIEIDTRSVTQLTDNDVRDRYPSISSDGTKIAFTRGSGGAIDDVWTMNIGGGGEVQITDTATADESVPVWNSDDTEFVFASDRDGNWELYTMDEDGANPVRLTNMAGIETDASWSPTDTRIVFESDTGGPQDVMVINADGTGVVNITSHAADDGDPDWSPDGLKIVFNSDLDGDNDIYTCNPDGTGLTKLTSNAHDDQDPQWSPDGEFIAFGSDRGGDYEIYIMRADGTDVTQITDDPGEDWWAAWGE